MSIAINPEFRTYHRGLRDFGIENLFNSLVDKLIEYFELTGKKVERIAAVGWTKEGVRLCGILGMKNTGTSEEHTDKPIFLLDLNLEVDRSNIHKSILRLIQYYDLHSE